MIISSSLGASIGSPMCSMLPYPIGTTGARTIGHRASQDKRETRHLRRMVFLVCRIMEGDQQFSGFHTLFGASTSALQHFLFLLLMGVHGKTRLSLSAIWWQRPWMHGAKSAAMALYDCYNEVVSVAFSPGRCGTASMSRREMKGEPRPRAQRGNKLRCVTEMHRAQSNKRARNGQEEGSFDRSRGAERRTSGGKRLENGLERRDMCVRGRERETDRNVSVLADKAETKLPFIENMRID